MTDRDTQLPARPARPARLVRPVRPARPGMRRLVRFAAAIGVAITLSGCIIAPPGYYRPHYYHPYYGY